MDECDFHRYLWRADILVTWQQTYVVRFCMILPYSTSLDYLKAVQEVIADVFRYPSKKERKKGLAGPTQLENFIATSLMKT